MPKKALLNITLGGQSKLSRPISSYNKADEDVDDVPSPDDFEGDSAEEKEEKNIDDSQASIKLMMDQLPVDTQRKDGGLQRAHELIMQSSLEYMVEDTQAFNKKIEQRLPVAIHAQQSAGEESTQKQIMVDQIILPNVESPPGHRMSTRSYRRHADHLEALVALQDE